MLTEKTDAENQPCGWHEPVPGHIYSSAASTERDAEKLEDPCLINQTLLASSEYSQFATGSVSLLTCRLGGVLGESDFFAELFWCVILYVWSTFDMASCPISFRFMFSQCSLCLLHPLQCPCHLPGWKLWLLAGWTQRSPGKVWGRACRRSGLGGMAPSPPSGPPRDSLSWLLGLQLPAPLSVSRSPSQACLPLLPQKVVGVMRDERAWFGSCGSDLLGSWQQASWHLPALPTPREQHNFHLASEPPLKQTAGGGDQHQTSSWNSALTSPLLPTSSPLWPGLRGRKCCRRQHRAHKKESSHSGDSCVINWRKGVTWAVSVTPPFQEPGYHLLRSLMVTTWAHEIFKLRTKVLCVV